MTHLLRLTAAAAAALALSGCTIVGSLFGSKGPEYKGAQARATQPLEVPPELTAPTMEDRYAIPDPRSQTTYSAYSQRTPGASPGSAAPGVLPRFETVRIDRAGDQRWLVVKGEPDKVWAAVREFWVDAGYPLAREQPELGIMETEWYEDRSKIPQDFVRRTIGRVLDNMWSTARRDKFRTRLEKGAAPGTTEIFVSNRSVEELFTNQQQDSTKWVPLPADRELEAEMLSRMSIKLGTGDMKMAAAAAAAPGKGPVRADAPAAPQGRNAVLENGGAGPLVVNDSFDRAWRRVGLALDRVGFTVEDRDRSKGLYFVRYVDPDADVNSKKPTGMLSKLAFWRSTPDPKNRNAQYRIAVKDASVGSEVNVLNNEGQLDRSDTANRILALLYEQLK